MSAIRCQASSLSSSVATWFVSHRTISFWMASIKLFDVKVNAAIFRNENFNKPDVSWRHTEIRILIGRSQQAGWKFVVSCALPNSIASSKPTSPRLARDTDKPSWHVEMVCPCRFARLSVWNPETSSRRLELPRDKLETSPRQARDKLVRVCFGEVAVMEFEND